MFDSNACPATRQVAASLCSPEFMMHVDVDLLWGVLVITTLPIISTTYYLVSTRILGISNSLMQTEDSAQAARLCSSHSVGKDVFAQPGLVSCLNVAACNVASLSCHGPGCCGSFYTASI